MEARLFENGKYELSLLSVACSHPKIYVMRFLFKHDSIFEIEVQIIPFWQGISSKL